MADSASLAVWDVPRPAEIRSDIRFKVGATQSAGEMIYVLDAHDSVVTFAQLGHEACTGTEALFWAHLWTPPTLQGLIERFRQHLRLQSSIRPLQCGAPCTTGLDGISANQFPIT